MLNTFAELPEGHRREAAAETCRGKRWGSSCKCGQTIVKRCQTVVKRSQGPKEHILTSFASACIGRAPFSVRKTYEITSVLEPFRVRFEIGDPVSSNLVYEWFLGPKQKTLDSRFMHSGTTGIWASAGNDGELTQWLLRRCF